MSKPFEYLNEICLVDVKSAFEHVKVSQIATSIKEDGLHSRILFADYFHASLPQLSEFELWDLAIFDIQDSVQRGHALVSVCGIVALSDRIDASIVGNVISNRFGQRDDSFKNAFLHAWLSSLRDNSLSILKSFWQSSNSVPFLLSQDCVTQFEGIVIPVEARPISETGGVSTFDDLINRLLIHDDTTRKIPVMRQLVSNCETKELQTLIRTLRDVVLNQSEDMPVREVAYDCIFELAKVPVENWPGFKRCLGSFEFPRDIDFEFLRRLERG